MKVLALGLCLSCAVLMPQSATASELVLPAGTAVSVRLSEPIDSALDGLGKQYSASVVAPVQVAGEETVAAGSPATIILMRNNSGWITRLTALKVNGREVSVASSAGTVAIKAAPELSTLQRIGIGQTTAEPTAEQRVLLATATELRFLLIGSGTPVKSLKAGSRSRTGVHLERSSDESSEPSQRTVMSVGTSQAAGIAYLCSAKDNPERALPTSYYIADVFETSDDPVLVQQHWYNFLVSTYPYLFANNAHAIVRCKRLEDAAAERDARNELEKQSKSENAQIVQTRWHYTLGPPPAASVP